MSIPSQTPKKMDVNLLFIFVRISMKQLILPKIAFIKNL